MKLSDYIRCYTRKIANYRIFTYAASASFFIITALMPLIMLTLSILSLTPLAKQDFLDMVAGALPESFHDIFYSITGDIVTTGVTALSVSMVISVVILLWSASKSVLGLLDGLNAIARVEDQRNYFTKRAVCIFYMLVFIIGMIVTLSFQVFAKVYSQRALARLQGVMPRLAAFLRVLVGIHKPVIFGFIALILVVIYTAFPNKKMRFLMQIPGALFAAFAWVAFSDLYSVFVKNFSSYPAVYGSIGVAVLAMIWLYFCVAFVFIGAVINQLYPSIFWRVHVGLRYMFMLRREESEESGRRLVRRYRKKKYRRQQEKRKEAEQQRLAQEQEKQRQQQLTFEQGGLELREHQAQELTQKQLAEQLQQAQKTILQNLPEEPGRTEIPAEQQPEQPEAAGYGPEAGRELQAADHQQEAAQSVLTGEPEAPESFPAGPAERSECSAGIEPGDLTGAAFRCRPEQKNRN